MQAVVLLVKYFTLVVCCAFGSTLVSQLVVKRGHFELEWLLKCLLAMISVTAVTTYFIRSEGQRWANYGVSGRVGMLSRAAAGLLGGCLLGMIWAGTIYCVAPFRWEQNGDVLGWPLLVGIISTSAIGIAEEVGYRSYGTEQAGHVAGVSGALLIPTSIFVAAHIVGGTPWLAGLLVVGTCSIVYGTLMLVTRSLPMVAAFHIGNNLVQDSFLRPSDMSIARLVYAQPAEAQNRSAEIWLWIAVANCVCIGVIIMLRRRSSFLILS